jgi:hypothetical protein
MAGKRIERAIELDNDRAAIAWLKRQDLEMEREQEEKGAGWYLLADVALTIAAWCLLAGIGYLVYRIVRLFV